MLFKTHIAFSVFLILLLISFIDEGLIFIFSVLIGTIILDLDSPKSKYGKSIIFRPLQFFVSHRGILHSLTFAIVVSVIVSIFFPVIGFGLFIGFLSHIFMDSLTKEGVRILWPLKFKTRFIIKTGGETDQVLFLVLTLINVTLLIFLIRSNI